MPRTDYAVIAILLFFEDDLLGSPAFTNFAVGREDLSVFDGIANGYLHEFVL